MTNPVGQPLPVDGNPLPPDLPVSPWSETSPIPGSGPVLAATPAVPGDSALAGEIARSDTVGFAPVASPSMTMAADTDGIGRVAGSVAGHIDGIAVGERFGTAPAQLMGSASAESTLATFSWSPSLSALPPAATSGPAPATPLTFGDAVGQGNIAMPLTLDSDVQFSGLPREAGLASIEGGAASALIDAPDGWISQPGGIATTSGTAQQITAGLQAQVSAPLSTGGPDWSHALAQRVGWMLEGQLGRAEIALDPPELGPLQVRITTQNDQTQVHFVSQHAAVRDALDQAMPRLREMLESQGLQLVQADVSNQRQGGGGQAEAGNPGTVPGSAADTGVAGGEPGSGHDVRHRHVGVGLIDAYA